MDLSGFGTELFNYSLRCGDTYTNFGSVLPCFAILMHRLCHVYNLPCLRSRRITKGVVTPPKMFLKRTGEEERECKWKEKENLYFVVNFITLMIRKLSRFHISLSRFYNMPKLLCLVAEHPPSRQIACHGIKQCASVTATSLGLTLHSSVRDLFWFETSKEQKENNDVHVSNVQSVNHYSVEIRFVIVRVCFASANHLPIPWLIKIRKLLHSFLFEVIVDLIALK